VNASLLALPKDRFVAKLQGLIESLAGKKAA